MSEERGYCSQHDMILQQMLEIGSEIRHMQRTLIRVFVAAISASSSLIGCLVVI